jgi:hypothetical protein
MKPLPAPTSRQLQAVAELSRFERQLGEFAQCVAGTDPQQLAALAIELQKTSLSLVTWLQRVPKDLQTDPELRTVARRIATQLAVLRESVLRQTARVNQGLGVLMPAAQRDTYAPSSGLAHTRYGSAGTRSGEFRAFSA